MMHRIIKTQLVLEFLAKKGFTRIQGEPFTFCSYGDSNYVVPVDEEYYWQDSQFLTEDWQRAGVGHLIPALLEFVHAQDPGQD